MFNIPVKKLRGIEKGTFVVLTDFCKDSANSEKKDYKEKHLYYANKFLELGWVIDDDTLRDGNFATIVPVLFDKNDPYQRTAKRYLMSKKKTFLYQKKSLIPIHTSTPEEIFNEIFAKNHHRHIGFRNAISRINFAYGSQKWYLKIPHPETIDGNG